MMEELIQLCNNNELKVPIEIFIKQESKDYLEFTRHSKLIELSMVSNFSETFVS